MSDKNLITIDKLRIANEELISGENWLGFDIRRLLIKYGLFLNNIKDPKILEIGSWKGRSSIFILKKILHNPEIKMYCCDTFQGSKEHNISNFLKIFKTNLSKFNLLDNVNIIEDRSENLLKHISPRTINFIYLDGSHEYFDVLTDLKVCKQLLLRGGIIVGDDYEWARYGGHDGVKRAVQRFLDTNQDSKLLETNYGFALKII